VEIKQVIVMRKDLKNSKGEKVRTGKLIAQGAHASMKAILDKGHFGYLGSSAKTEFIIELEKEDPIRDWIEGLFTKVCLQVNSENELMDIYIEANKANLPCALIKDSGLTEFGGVPTRTCIAIGPAKSEEIDKITGHLPLF